MLHHSPLPDGHSRRKRLRDAAQITETLLQFGAELVIHGHGHEERIDRLEGANGPMLVVAVPSASYSVTGRAGWNRYCIDGEPGRWQLDVEARRTSADGFATTTRQTLTWNAPVSRAVLPRSR